MGNYRKKCELCEGRGWITAMTFSPVESELFRVCLSCFGTGWIYGIPSFELNGEHLARESEMNFEESVQEK